MNPPKLKNTGQYIKSITYLHTGNEKSKNEIKKTISSAVAPKIIKHLKINVAK
jgi:hypothetical protein